MVDQDMLVFLVKRIIEEFFRVFTKKTFITPCNPSEKRMSSKCKAFWMCVRRIIYHVHILSITEFWPFTVILVASLV